MQIGQDKHADEHVDAYTSHGVSSRLMGQKASKCQARQAIALGDKKLGSLSDGIAF